jgi:Arc/MetJ-type ribon-helix-helix transcriptional regulator
LRYTEKMARSIHVRLDDASVAALEIVRATEMSDSDAVRTALREAAARRRIRSTIAREVAELAGDTQDRAEMQRIREQMAELAPTLGD